MEICKAPTLWLKTLKKRNTHNVHWDGKWYHQFNKKLTHNVDINKGLSITIWKKDAHIHTHTHTHTCVYARTRTVQTDKVEGQCRLTEIAWEEKCLEFAFEVKESSLADVLVEIVPDVKAEVWESAKAMGFAVQALKSAWTWLWEKGYVYCLLLSSKPTLHQLSSRPMCNQ